MKKGILIIALVCSWFTNLAQQDTVLYSFFSAGHAYGSPLNVHYGLHYPFVDYIPALNNYPKLDFGCFTGDVVYHSTEAYWDSAEVDFAKLNMPFHIAAGNHDLNAYFRNRYAPDVYSSFIHKGDLFIILAPGLNNWNIESDQLTFLTTTLNNDAQNVKNIFIFMHELIWWSPTNKYQNIEINYEPHYPGSTNYESVVKPLLKNYSNPITLIAGDVGCKIEVSPFMYDTDENITLLASGMGGGLEDNIIITDVYKDSVHHNVIALNGNDPHVFGNLKDYIVSGQPYQPMLQNVKVFPNPTTNYVNISNPDRLNLAYSISNINGQQVKEGNLGQVQNNKIHMNQLNCGLYFLTLSTDSTSFQYRIIVK